MTVLSINLINTTVTGQFIKCEAFMIVLQIYGAIKMFIYYYYIIGQQYQRLGIHDELKQCWLNVWSCDIYLKINTHVCLVQQ